MLSVIGFTNLPKGKYYDKNIQLLVDENKAQVIEIGKKMKVDNDDLIIKRIINTEDQTYIRYALIRSESGWSFSENALKIFDDKGQEYQSVGGGWSGRLWGQDGLMLLDKKIGEDVKSLTIKLDWYDRKNELNILLSKEGEVNENL